MERVELYHKLYRICLMGAGISLVVAVVLFWRMEITKTIGFFTGRRARKEIQKLEEREARNRNIRVPMFACREEKTVLMTPEQLIVRKE